ncbi:hypothetical protein M2137_002650 [Parabacteroides sp. PFB2-10]|uniref:hypothetical protein n=1 Tax=Parabacteroides sp. PFB2-10 TaxID=1742405 RepID=UPI0024761D88|nr:hypothetical protein [Parabacteroides sp. PFB2-10]MDH6313859.1 hypothetical protein [Parabacteroides sp. PFB2-10]MDL2244926.1 hypothetical protein [Parabacteroides sp. OttesenSCG-928-J18]
MKAAYGFVESRGNKILIGVVVATWLILVGSLLYNKNWVGASFQLINLVALSYLFYQRSRNAIQVTDSDKLTIGSFPIPIKDIVDLERVGEYGIRVHYSYYGSPRKSPKVNLREDDITSLLLDLQQINPEITIR